MTQDRMSLWIRVFTTFTYVWPWFDPTPERALVWDEALCDLNDEQIRSGAARALANHSGSQPPTPGEIRDGALGKVSWKSTRHDVTGQIIGRETVREFIDEEILPAPRGLIALFDKDRAPLALPGGAAELVNRLSNKMTPPGRHGEQR